MIPQSLTQLFITAVVFHSFRVMSFIEQFCRRTPQCELKAADSKVTSHSYLAVINIMEVLNSN